MGPRPLRPKDEPGTPEDAEGVKETKGNKRRAVSSACFPCRKRKSKCDGRLPACSTCVAVHRTECNYDVDVESRRNAVPKRETPTFRQESSAVNVVLSNLCSLPEDDAISLLHSLRSGSHRDKLDVVARADGRPPKSFASQTLEALEADTVQDVAQLSPVQALVEPPISATVLADAHGRPDAVSQIQPDIPPSVDSQTVWFSKPQDAELVEHLLNLYFCWIHPFYCSFSRDHFLYDMSRRRMDYCSPILVNAILAFACHYSDRAQARTDPEDPATAGDLFFAEARKLMDASEKPSLTNVQALGIMSLRECSHGRDSNAYQLAGRCVRMALELGLHLSVFGSALPTSEVEVRRITFWGVFNLETICSIGFGRLSQLPRSAADILKPSINGHADFTGWRLYEDANLTPITSAEQPTRQMLFVDCLSRLCELASDMVNTFYAPHERFTSRRLAATYGQYQEWYHNLPDAFRLQNTSLPHVIVLHMFYYACVLHLFRPYIKLDLRGANLYPQETCTLCANEISTLMSALRAIYGLRRVCLAVTNLILSASTVHLLNLPAETAAMHLSQGLHDLQAMSVNHQFAGRCVDIIRGLANKWRIALPEDAASVPVFRRQWGSPLSSTFFAANFPRSQPSKGDSASGSSTSSREPRDAVFPPPSSDMHQAQQGEPRQQQNQMAAFGPDAQAVLAPVPAQAVFIPFPGQSVPLGSGNFNDILSELELLNPQQTWTMFGGSAEPLSTTQIGPSHSLHLASDGTMVGVSGGEWQ